MRRNGARRTGTGQAGSGITTTTDEGTRKGELATTIGDLTMIDELTMIDDSTMIDDLTMIGGLMMIDGLTMIDDLTTEGGIEIGNGCAAWTITTTSTAITTGTGFATPVVATGDPDLGKSLECSQILNHLSNRPLTSFPLSYHTGC